MTTLGVVIEISRFVFSCFDCRRKIPRHCHILVTSWLENWTSLDDTFFVVVAFCGVATMGVFVRFAIAFCATNTTSESVWMRAAPSQPEYTLSHSQRLTFQIYLMFPSNEVICLTHFSTINTKISSVFPPDRRAPRTTNHACHAIFIEIDVSLHLPCKTMESVYVYYYSIHYKTVASNASDAAR